MPVKAGSPGSTAICIRVLFSLVGRGVNASSIVLQRDQSNGAYALMIIAKHDKSCQDMSRVKIYPDILIAAARGANGGGARLWTLAKHANPGGCGSIPNKALRQYVINDLNIKRGVYDVWLIRALHIGLLERKGKNIKLAGFARAAAILGVDRVGPCKFIRLDRFIKKGWLPWVWAAWIQSHKLEGKQISRKTLSDLSGIKERSQRLYSNQAGIITKRHYAKDTTRPGSQGLVDHINEFERDRIKSKAFLNNGEICWRRPNSYETKGIEAAPNKSLGRINRQLMDLQNNGGQDPKNNRPIVRQNCKTDNQLKKALKEVRRLANKGVEGLPDYLYLKAPQEGFSYAIPA